MMLDHIGQLSERILLLDRELRHRAARDDVARRLMTVPGIGPDLRHGHRGSRSRDIDLP